MSNRVFIVYNIFTVLIWYGIILTLGTIPNLDITGTTFEIVLRNIGYAVMYSILFLLIYRALNTGFKFKVNRLMFWRSKGEEAEDREFVIIVESLLFFISILAIILLASLDEYLQQFTVGRITDLSDVIIAGIGGIFSAFLVMKFPILTEVEAVTYLKKSLKNSKSSTKKS